MEENCEYFPLFPTSFLLWAKVLIRRSFSTNVDCFMESWRGEGRNYFYKNPKPRNGLNNDWGWSGMDNKRITALFRHLLKLTKKHTTGGLKRRFIFVESTRNLQKIHVEKFAFSSTKSDFPKCFSSLKKKFNYFTTLNRFSLALNCVKSWFP